MPQLLEHIDASRDVATPLGYPARFLMVISVGIAFSIGKNH
jgi:hypothetical protein